MPTQWSRDRFGSAPVEGRRVAAAFDGGEATSDAGALLLLGVDSLEFDDEGTATISFVTIRQGSFTLQIPGTTSDSQRATFTVGP